MCAHLPRWNGTDAYGSRSARLELRRLGWSMRRQRGVWADDHSTDERRRGLRREARTRRRDCGQPATNCARHRAAEMQERDEEEGGTRQATLREGQEAQAAGQDAQAAAAAGWEPMRSTRGRGTEPMKQVSRYRWQVAFGVGCVSLLATLGWAAAPAKVGADSACGNEIERVQQHSGYLPNCRAYELASPEVENGGEVIPNTTTTRAAIDGHAIAFASLTGFGDVMGMGIGTEYLAERSSALSPGNTGWSTHAITPPQEPQSTRSTAANFEPQFQLLIPGPEQGRVSGDEPAHRRTIRERSWKSLYAERSV